MRRGAEATIAVAILLIVIGCAKEGKQLGPGPSPEDFGYSPAAVKALKERLTPEYLLSNGFERKDPVFTRKKVKLRDLKRIRGFKYMLSTPNQPAVAMGQQSFCVYIAGLYSCTIDVPNPGRIYADVSDDNVVDASVLLKPR